MIKLRNAVLALAACLLATGALAQTAYFTQDSDAVTVAEELFGSGSVKLEFDEFRGTGSDDMWVPKARLIYGGSAFLGTNTEFHVTLTLSNATFAEPVSNADFMWGTWGPANSTRGGLDCNTTTTGTEGDAGVPAGTGDDATKRIFCPFPPEVALERTGGGKNTNSVSFKVTVHPDAVITGLATPTQDATTMEYTGTTRMILFAVPDLNAMGLVAANDEGKGGKSVGVSVTISQPKSGGTAIMESVEDAHMCGETEVVKSPGTAACPVVSAAKVITSIAATAGGGTISLVPTDERSVLVGGDGKAVDPQRAHLATVTVTANFGTGARDQDGDMIDADYGFTNDLAGSLAISVASAGFNDGDQVYIDANGNKKVDGREAFAIDGGVAMDTVPLAAGSSAVYYVPSGDDELKHRTTFTTTATTEFSDLGNKNRGTPAPAVAMLKLFGIKDTAAKAYAIAPVGHSDRANVRVTCETTAKTGCNVFLDCTDAMGTNTFGDTGAMIGPGMTVTWNQMEIAEALELEDGWEGRMRCDVLSSDEITVQILTRAAGVLVNNTATSEGGT